MKKIKRQTVYSRDFFRLTKWRSFFRQRKNKKVASTSSQLAPELCTPTDVWRYFKISAPTLRRLEQQGKIKKVRVGKRQVFRYRRQDLATTFAGLTSSPVHRKFVRPNIRLLSYRRIAVACALGAIYVVLTISPALVSADDQSSARVAVPFQECRGWVNGDAARQPSSPPTSRGDLTGKGASLSRENIAVAEGAGSLNAISDTLTCGRVNSTGLDQDAKVDELNISWDATLEGTIGSGDVVIGEWTTDRKNWKHFVITPLSEPVFGRQQVMISFGSTVRSLADLQIRFRIEFSTARPFQINLMGLGLGVSSAVKEKKPDQEPTKNSKTSRSLDKLVRFSRDTYAATERPLISVPKRVTKRFLFVPIKQVEWSLKKVELLDHDLAIVKAEYSQSDTQDGSDVSTAINFQTRNLHPGKYTVRVSMRDSDGNEALIEESFLWGVVAVNFDRAAPQAGLEEQVGIGILDDKGRTICDADVVVKVRDPRGRTATYRTSKKTVTKNPNCIDKGITNEPDYHFSFKPKLPGTYHLTLKAKTSFGDRSYEENLFVTDNQVFDIHRIDYPTRINPYAGYPVRIAITPRRDYSGLVYERVPSDFKISAIRPAAKIEDDLDYPGMKRIVWEVEWKAQNTYYLAYKFVTPVISPALFKTGPLTIRGNSLLDAELTEPRQWQIASDSASSISWDGSASALWSDGANWSTGSIPQAGDNLVFPAGAANYSNTNDLGENSSFNSITFYDSGYTLAGDRMILGQGFDGITDAVASGGNTISMDLRVDATRWITVTNSGETLTISGRISGVGGITKEGLGKLVLSGANSYGGVTKVNVGVLNAQNSRSLGTIAGGTEVVGNAALELEGTIAIDREALTLRGYGVSNGGALRNIQDNNSFDGLITIAGMAEVASDSDTLTLNGGVTGAAIPLVLDGAGDITFAKAPIANTSGLVTKNGAGTLTYNFPNTYTGLTTINAGTVELGVNNAFLSGGITVNGGTLDMNTFSDMVGTVTLGTLAGGSGTITGSTGVLSSASYVVYAGTISAIIAGDAGTLAKSTFGTVTLTRPNQYTGATTVTVGTLVIQDSLGLGLNDGITTVSSGATLQIDGNGLSVPEFITISGLGLKNAGAIANTTGNNTINGLVTMAAASTIQTANSTTLTIATSGITGTFALTIDGDGDTNISAPIYTSSGTLTKDGSGDLTLSAYNPFTGATAINLGSLILNGNGSIAVSASVSVRSGAKLVMDNSSVVTDRIGDSIAVTMNGGDMEFYGNTSTSTVATAGALTLSSGQNTISVFAAAGGPTILRFASLTRTAGATGLFRGTNLGATPAANVATLLFTTAPTLLGDDGVSGTPTLSILQGIFGDNSTSGTGTDMVTYGRGNNNGVRLLNGAGFSNEYTTDLTTTNANIKLSGATAAVTSQINSLILDTGASITNPGSAQTMTFMSGNIINQQPSGSIAGANTTLAGGAVEFVVRAAQNLDISSLITTSGGLSKSGSGTLTFSTSKTYTGLTSINAGTLLYGVNDAISSGAVTINDATLDIDTYTDTVGAVIVQGATITGSTGVLTATSYDFRASTGSAILAGSGTLTVSNTNERAYATSTLTRDNTFTGAVAVSSGVLRLGTDGDGTNSPLGTIAAGTTVSNGAMLDLNGQTLTTNEALNFRGTGIALQGAIINSSVTAVTYPGALTITTSGRIGADYGKITISGSISGTGLPLTVGGFGDIDITGAITTGASGTVTKEGFGTYTPSNSGSTYTGATTINAGTLKLGVSGGATNSSIGTAAAALAITSGATFDMNGFSMSAAAKPLTLAGTGAGSGDFAGGALINSSGSSVTWSGVATINTATIKANAGTITLSASTVAGTTAVTLGGSGNGVITGALAAGAASIVKIDSGSWNLAGASQYTGATTIYQGTIQLGGTGSGANAPLGTVGAGTTVFSGGVLDLNGNTLTTAEGLTYNGFGISNGGAVINNSGSGVTYSGTRALGSDSRTTNSGAGLLTLSGIQSGVFESRYGGAGNITISAAIAATASTLLKDGAGTLNLTAANRHTGVTTVNAGTLTWGINSALSSGGLTLNGGTANLATFTDTIGALIMTDGVISGSSGVLTATAYTLESGTISGIITGAVAVTKNTAGKVIFSGAQTLSSTLTINAGEVEFSGNGTATTVTGVTINLGGTLTLDNSATNNTDRLNGTGGTNAIVVTMNGGNFNYKGSSSTNASETISQLAFAAGHNVVTVTPGTGGSTTLTMGNATCLNRSVGATVLYRGTSFGSTPAANVSTLQCSTPPTLIGGGGGSSTTTISILRGSFGDGSLTGTGTDMVTFNVGNTNGLRLLNGAGFSGEYVSNGFGTNNSNVKITTNTAAATQNINSIVINGGDVTNPGSTQTITTSGASLAGNLLIASANNFAGSNTVVALTAATELSTLATNATTISALIGNSTTGIGVFSGSANITVSAAQTYTGTTYVNNGHTATTSASLTYGAANVLSTGGVTIVGGVYNPNGNADSVGAITMTAGSITTGAATLTTTGTLTTVANANATALITGTVALPAASTLNIADGLVENDATITAVLTSSSTSLTKSTGTGVAVFSGNSTYTGSTAINAGTLRFGTAGSSGNGPLGTTAATSTVANGAVLDFNGYSLTNTEALSISGSGISSGGVLINSSSTAVTYSGLLTFATSGPTITANYGDINLTNTGNITGTFNLTLAGAGNGSLASNLNISTGTLTKSGAGTWTISGAGSTFTGSTTVSVGVLKLGAAGSGSNTPFGTSAGGVSVTSGAVLDLNGFTLGLAETLTLAGTGIASAGALTTSSGSATNWSGAVVLGTTPRVTNYGGGTFSLTGAISGNNALTVVNAPGDITIGTGVWSGSGTLTKEGWGTTIMTGQNSMSGALTVSTGTLRLGANGGGTNTPFGTIAGGVVVSAGAVLDLSTFVLGGASTWEPITLNGTGINNGGALISSSTSGNSFGALTLGSNTRLINSASGLINVTGSVNGAFLLIVGGSGPTTISGSLNVAGITLTKMDAGTLILSGALQSNTGLVRINGGTLQYGVSNAINTGAVTVAGGTLDFNGQTDSVGAVTLMSGTITDSNVTPGVLSGGSYTVYGGTISGVLGGAVTLTKSTGATVTMNKVNSYSSTTTISGGTLQYLASNVISNSSAVNVAGGTLDMGANSDTVAAVTLTSGSIIGSGTLTGSSYAVMSGTISPILAGAVNLTKTTAGTVTLSGTNTYTGITTISGGVLSVGTIGNGGVAGNLGQATNAAANIVFNTGTGTLQYTGTSASTDRNFTTTNAILTILDVTNPATTLTMSGAGTSTTALITKAGMGTLTLSGANLHTGLTSVLAGTLKLGAADVILTGAVTVHNGILDLNNFSDSVGTVTLTNGGQIIDSGGTTAALTSTATFAFQSGKVSAELQSTVASGISKTTTDRVILSGDNVFTSTAIAVSAGALNVQHNNALGASGTALLVTVSSGAVLEIQNTVTIPSTKTYNLTGTGVVSGGAIKNVADNNTLVGAVALAASGVRINSSSGTLTISGNMTGSGNAITFGGAGNVTYSGVIGTVAGTVTKDGIGTYSPTNTNTYTGLTTVSAGVLAISTAQSTGTTGGGVTVASGAAVEISGTTTVGVEALTLNGTGISSGGALRSTSGTTAWQGAVAISTTSSIGVDANTLTISGTITGSGSAGLTKVGSGTLSVATTDIGGNLLISAGTLSAAGGISVAGDWTNSGTFTANSQTVTLDGTAQQAVSGTTSGSTGKFNNLIVTNAFGDGSTTWSVTFAGDTETAATFTAVTANTKLRFNAGSTYTFQNISFNGQAGGTKVFLRSSTNTSAWNLVVLGTRSVSYTDVRDSDATGSGTSIDASNGTNTDSTGNTNWSFFGFTVSGGCFTDETEGTPCSDDGANEIRVAINGVLDGVGDTTVDGSWSFTPSTPANGATMVFFINGEATESEEATTVVKYDGSGDVTQVKLYQSQLVIGTDSGSANSNQTIASSDLDPAGNGYDNTDDEDVLQSFASNLLTVDDDNNKTEQLYIMHGETFRPDSGGGDTITTHHLEIDSTATITADSNALNVAGDWTNNGTFTANTSTVTLNGSAAQTMNTNSQSFNNLTFNNTGANGSTDDIIISGALDVNGTFNLTNGDLDINTNDPAVNTAGNVTIGSSAFVTSGSGTWTFDGDLTFTDNTSPKQDLGAVAIGTSPDTTDLASDMTAKSIVINSGDVLNTNGYDLDIGADGLNIIGTLNATDDVETDETLITIAGDFASTTTSVFTADQSTVRMDGTGSHTITNKGDGFYNLETNNSGTYTIGGQVTDDFERGSLGGNYTIRTGTPAITGSSDYHGTVADHNKAIYSATTFGDDQWAESTISAMSAGNEVHACIRLNDTGPVDGYCMATDGAFLEIFRLDDNAYGALVVSTTTYPSVGDTIRIEGLGSELRGYINGQLVLRGTDATYTAGYPGLSVWATGTPTSTIEAFAAGSLLVATNDLTNTQGTVALGVSSAVVQGGDITVTGTLSQSSSGVTTVTSTGSIAGSGTTTFGSLVTGNSGTTQTTTAGGNFSAVTLLIPTSSGTNTFDASSRTITISGSGTPFLINATETFTASSSTLVYTGAAATNVTVTTYNNLSIHPSSNSITHTLLGGGTITVGGALSVGNGTNTGVSVNAETNDPTIDANGSFTINANTTYSASSSSALTIAGNYTNSGTLTENTSTITLDGATSLSFNSGCASVTSCSAQEFYNLTINKTDASSSNDNVTLTSNGIRVTNTLTITDGELIQGALNVYVNGGTAVSVASGGTWTNISTGDLTLAGTFANAGSVTFAGNGLGCGAADDISITSSSGGSQRAWSGAGTFTMDDVSVQDQGGSAAITVYSGTSVSGNGGNWTFSGCGITISGVLYEDDSTPLNCAGDNHPIVVKVNGAGSFGTTCTDADGNYSVTGVTIGSAGDVITIFTDISVTGFIPATAVTRAADTTSDITDMELWGGYVIVRHENAGPTTNANLGQYDNDDDVDVGFTSNSNNLVVDGTRTLFIRSGKTHLPGGTVTMTSLLTLDTSANFTVDTASSSLFSVNVSNGATFTINASSSYANGIGTSGTGTITTTSGTPTATINGGSIGGGSGAVTFYALTIGGVVTWAGSGTNTVNNNISITSSGALTQNSSLTVAGNIVNTTTGSMDFIGTTPTLTVQGSSLGGGSGKMQFYNLTKSNAGTLAWTGSGQMIVKNTLTVSAGTLTMPSGTVYVEHINQTGGTITHNSGSVMLNSPTSRTQTISSSLNNVTINDGLVGYWNFDETAGTSAADSSGYGHTGSHINTPTISTDVPTVNFPNARSLSFNGSSQYVNIGTPEWMTAQWTNKLSIAAWIKPATTSGDHVIIGQSDNAAHISPFYTWNIFQSGSTICFRIGLTNPCSAGGVLTTGWQHIAARYDGANMYLYVNGTQVATAAYSANIVNSGRNIRIAGRDTSALAEYFGGLIDDVRVYRRDLSTGEITTLSGGDTWGLSGATNTLGAALTLAGSLTNKTGTLDVDNSGNYALNVAGNWANDGGLFTKRSGTVTLNGGAQQTVSGYMTSSSQFHHLTVTNNSGSDPDSSPSVIFSDGFSTAGTFTAATANTKLRFAAGKTYSPTAFAFDGLATGTRVHLRSSTPGTLFTFTAGAGSRSISNTAIKDSSACASSGGSIDASNGTNRDDGRTPCWLISTLNVSLSGTSINLGTLTSSLINRGNITSTVTTNAATGYSSLVKYGATLTSGANTIPNTDGTIAIGQDEFGASTSDSGNDISLWSPTSCTGTTSSSSTATALSTTFQSFASSTSAASSEATTLCLLAGVSATKASGTYSSTITIVTTAKF